MNDRNDVAVYADWLADLTNGDLAGEDLRTLLATRTKSAEAVDRAAVEVEIARRVRVLMFGLKLAEVEILADFEARLMARVSEDATLLNLLEVYLTGFGQTLVALINLLFGLFPESRTLETNAA